MPSVKVVILLTFTSILCQDQTTRYYCLVKCLLCQIRRFKSHKFLQGSGRETLQTTHHSPVNYHLQFTMCVTSLARKCLSLTTTATDKLSWEVNKKSDMLLFLSWGPEASWMRRQVVVHYEILHEMKRSIVAPETHWLFPSQPDALHLLSQAVIGLMLCSLTSALEQRLVMSQRTGLHPSLSTVWIGLPS